MSVNAVDLFPRANELFVDGFIGNNYVSDLSNGGSSISSLVPWSLLTKISIDGTYHIKAAEVEAILRMAYNVHTLQTCDDDGSLSHAILHNIDNLGTRANGQVSISILKDKIH
jgi:hypothetical protein